MFDEAEFERLALVSVAAVRSECSRDPGHFIQREAVVELGDRYITWCADCGAKLLPGPDPDEL
jgi:hypothetical protein